ncbi:hypothetical protein C8J31_11467 [Rhizobium sp. PP-CC-2G-626]|nr:hypothetical protein C8J31_11467 [Rhizobium sp. PP-CC-2G-626]
MIILITWIICGIVTGIIASSKGRTGVGWFLIGSLLGIFGLILIACLPSLRSSPQSTQALPEHRLTMTCPDCAETVLQAANVCKHCGVRFSGARVISR